MQKTFLSIACISGALAVVLGAFGAHALKAKLSAPDLLIFETGVKYQMYHTFALIAIGVLMDKFPLQSYLNGAGYFFIAGMILFSGSLYLLAVRSLLGIENWRWMGPVTPLGGLAFIIGWALLLLTVCSCSPKNQVQHPAKNSETKSAPPAASPPSMNENHGAATYRLILSFVSQGSGTDTQAYTLFEEYIKKYRLEKQDPLPYETINWGKEGEVDYCFPLKTLKAEAQQNFISGLKTLLKEHPLVLYKEHAQEHRSPRKF